VKDFNHNCSNYNQNTKDFSYNTNNYSQNRKDFSQNENDYSQNPLNFGENTFNLSHKTSKNPNKTGILGRKRLKEGKFDKSTADFQGDTNISPSAPKRGELRWCQIAPPVGVQAFACAPNQAEKISETHISPWRRLGSRKLKKMEESGFLPKAVTLVLRRTHET
jgi:hypothetical protein